MRLVLTVLLLGLLFSQKTHAQIPDNLTIRETVVTDYRPVVARLESSDTADARARISGIVMQLNIDEGSVVKKGDTIAVIRDETLIPQINALDAQIAGIRNQLTKYESDLARGEKLHKDGYYTTANLEQARTAVDVTRKSLASVRAQRAALVTQRTKGIVTASADARVTEVLISQGTAVSPGEIIAKLATLDGVVRLSLPERHAGQIAEGEILELHLPARGGLAQQARITKIYPELRNGAVIADAEVENGISALVGERVDVLVPVGERRAFLIPKSYITTRYGIDFIKVHIGEHILEAPVTLANPNPDPSGYVEVLSGLHEGDVVEKP